VPIEEDSLREACASEELLVARWLTEFEYVNLSAATLDDVPPGVVTVRATAPALPADEVALQEVVDVQLTWVPALLPNMTVVDPATKPTPVIVTTVPPAVRPVLGVIRLIVGTRS
jgi:hypothetical protein